MATPFTVYKLIVLYMLQNTENTLTNSQISEFILDREYTNYFHLQQAISELVEAELITMDTRSNVSQLICIFYIAARRSDSAPAAPAP